MSTYPKYTKLVYSNLRPSDTPMPIIFCKVLATHLCYEVTGKVNVSYESKTDSVHIVISQDILTFEKTLQNAQRYMSIYSSQDLLSVITQEYKKEIQTYARKKFFR